MVTKDAAGQRRRAAMAAYVRAAAPRRQRRFVLDDSLMAHVRTLREEIRAENGGGGMCHLVTEALWDEFGLGRVAVSYLTPGGEVVCAGHYVNVLHDGCILDPTADQFGEGHDVRVLGPEDVDFGRYRPEFDRDWNPVADPARLSGWAEDWSGVEDHEAEMRLRAERGYGWHVENCEALLAYLRKQQVLTRRAAPMAGDPYPKFLERCVEDVEAASLAGLEAWRERT